LEKLAYLISTKEKKGASQKTFGLQIRASRVLKKKTAENLEGYGTEYIRTIDKERYCGCLDPKEEKRGRLWSEK